MFNMQSQSGVSKRQAKKLDAKDRWKQAKERLAGTQKPTRHRLPF
jgi:hypothetical protein